MKVQAATETDARCIAEIHIRSWQSAYRGIVPDDYLAGLSIERREAAWTEMLRDGSNRHQVTFLVEIEGQAVGFVHAGPSRDDDAPPGTGEVTSIYLLPELWGRGAGRLLIGRAVQWLKEASFTSASLWVLAENVRARRFYEAGGWRPDGMERVSDRGSVRLVEVRLHRAI